MHFVDRLFQKQHARRPASHRKKRDRLAQNIAPCALRVRFSSRRENEERSPGPDSRWR
jgi:hypothetical protein